MSFTAHVRCPLIRQLTCLICRQGCLSHIANQSLTHSRNLTVLSHQRPQKLQYLLESHNPFFGSTYQLRLYAKKNKDKKDKGGKKGKSHTHAELSSEELHLVIAYDGLKQEMSAALESMQQKFNEELSVRTNPSAFERLIVTTPDGKFPLVQLGQVSQKGADLIIVNMTPSPQYCKDVKTALMESGMNLNPQQEGLMFYIPLPKITREHREQLAKNAKMLCDRTKDKLRDIQNKYLREVKKKKDEFSKDLIHNLQETIMSDTDEFRSQAEKLMKAKQEELQIKK